MSATIKTESTLTDRDQTTVPETVRRSLRLGKRNKIHCALRPDSEVGLTRAVLAEGDDLLVGQFRGVLARDIAAHPERLQSVDAGLARRIQSLVGGVEVNLDTPLSANDE